MTTMARQSAATDKASDDVSDLKDDIEKLRADLSSLTKHMKELGGSAVADARKAGEEKVDDLLGELDRTAQQLKRQGEASVAEVESTIRERPLLSLIAAFGVGMLITRLLERR